MQKGTNRRSVKMAAIICAAVVIVILLIYLAVFLFPVLGGGEGSWVVIGVLALCTASILLLIGGIITALRQRLKEIESGEEEDAKRY